MPCCFRHASSAVRRALEPLLVAAEDDVDVVVEPPLEVLPHAAIARLAATTPAGRSISRGARRSFLAVDFTSEECSDVRLIMGSMSLPPLSDTPEEAETLLSEAASHETVGPITPALLGSISAQTCTVGSVTMKIAPPSAALTACTSPWWA